MDSEKLIRLKENKRTLEVILRVHKKYYVANNWGSNKVSKGFQEYLEQQVNGASEVYIEACEKFMEAK